MNIVRWSACYIVAVNEDCLVQTESCEAPKRGLLVYPAPQFMNVRCRSREDLHEIAPLSLHA